MPRLAVHEPFTEVISFKLTKRQMRQCRRAARERGLRFTVWAREQVCSVLRGRTPAAPAMLSAPTLPSKP